MIICEQEYSTFGKGRERKMELWEAVKAISPGWWLLAVCLAVAPLVLAPIVTRIIVSVATYFLHCPVCGTRIINRNAALRMLAVKHRISLNISSQEMKKELAELATADDHQHHATVVYDHLDGNGRDCSCLITFDVSGQLGVANYAPLGATQEVR